MIGAKFFLILVTVILFLISIAMLYAEAKIGPIPGDKRSGPITGYSTLILALAFLFFTIWVYKEKK